MQPTHATRRHTAGSVALLCSMQRLDPVTAASGKVGDRQLATAARQAKERRPDLDGRAAGSGVSRASDPDGVEELRAARKLEANAIALHGWSLKQLRRVLLESTRKESSGGSSRIRQREKQGDEGLGQRTRSRQGYVVEKAGRHQRRLPRGCKRAAVQTSSGVEDGAGSRQKKAPGSHGFRPWRSRGDCLRRRRSSDGEARRRPGMMCSGGGGAD